MKRNLSPLLLAIAVFSMLWLADAAFYQVNVGTLPNDNTGDPLRTAYQKLNSNWLSAPLVFGGLQSNNVWLGWQLIETNGLAVGGTSDPGAGNITATNIITGRSLTLTGIGSSWISNNVTVFNALGALSVTASNLVNGAGANVGFSGGILVPVTGYQVVYFTNTIPAAQAVTNAPPFIPAYASCYWLCVANDTATKWVVGDVIPDMALNVNDLLNGPAGIYTVWSSTNVIVATSQTTMNTLDMPIKGNYGVSSVPTSYANFRLVTRVANQ